MVHGDTPRALFGHTVRTAELANNAQDSQNSLKMQNFRNYWAKTQLNSLENSPVLAHFLFFE